MSDLRRGILNLGVSQSELGGLGTPIVNFINKNFDPHTIVIITNDRIDLYRGEMGAGIGYFMDRKEKEHADKA